MACKLSGLFLAESWIMNDISLREFIERIISENNLRRDDLRREDDRRISDAIKHLKEMFHTSTREVDRARELQALDYKEHFERLNGEAGRILKAIEVTVSRDTWDGFQKEFLELKESVTIELATRSAGSKNMMISFSLVSLFSIVISVTIAILNYVR